MASDESKEQEPYWTGPGYRHEYNCPHGVGHGNHVHGCCGSRCCQRDDFPLNPKNLKATRAAEILQGVGPFRVSESK